MLLWKLGNVLSVWFAVKIVNIFSLKRGLFSEAFAVISSLIYCEKTVINKKLWKIMVALDGQKW